MLTSFNFLLFQITTISRLNRSLSSVLFPSLSGCQLIKSTLMLWALLYLLCKRDILTFYSCVDLSTTAYVWPRLQGQLMETFAACQWRRLIITANVSHQRIWVNINGLFHLLSCKNDRKCKTTTEGKSKIKLFFTKASVAILPRPGIKDLPARTGGEKGLTVRGQFHGHVFLNGRQVVRKDIIPFIPHGDVT